MVPTNADTPIEMTCLVFSFWGLTLIREIRSYVPLVVSPISILGITRQIIMSPMVLIPPAFIIIPAKASGRMKQLIILVIPNTKPKNMPPL